MPFMRLTRMRTTDRLLLLLLLQNVKVTGRFMCVACTIDLARRRFGCLHHCWCPIAGCCGWNLGDVSSSARCNVDIAVPQLLDGPVAVVRLEDCACWCTSKNSVNGESRWDEDADCGLSSMLVLPLNNWSSFESLELNISLISSSGVLFLPVVPTPEFPSLPVSLSTVPVQFSLEPVK
uniref:Putative secreted protein n=1 Tax=Anopheles darlingi TaxID=43151 RepID=A0A2M4DGW8_ANODA